MKEFWNFKKINIIGKRWEIIKDKKEDKKQEEIFKI